MTKIRISDVTMKQSTDRISLSFREKIELSKLLDKLGCSVIELEGIASPRSDALRIKSIASAVKESIVAVPVSMAEGSAEAAWAALKEAKFPRLQVPAATSSVQMEYLYHKKPQVMLENISASVAACRACCQDVEFIAEDATRADPDFLQKAIAAAVRAGATVVTLCDTAGTMLPDEFCRFVKEAVKEVPDTVSVAVSCCDTLSMADACSMAALGAGISEIKASAYPVTTASLGNISRIICARGDSFDASCTIHVTQLSRALSQISAMCESGRSKTSPFDNGVRENSDLFLTAHDDLEALKAAVVQLGYDLSPEDEEKVYGAFLAIAQKKDRVSARELDAIVASAAMQVPPAYQLEIYSIQSGNTVSATAHLRIAKDGKAMEAVSIGDGPIDAAFLAIEQITGRHFELDDFQIQAVTEGREAMGQTVVKLLSGGKLYSGKGISTDIVGASIQAYLSALNKITYEEVMA